MDSNPLILLSERGCGIGSTARVDASWDSVCSRSAQQGAAVPEEVQCLFEPDPGSAAEGERSKDDGVMRAPCQCSFGACGPIRADTNV